MLLPVLCKVSDLKGMYANAFFPRYVYNPKVNKHMQQIYCKVYLPSPPPDHCLD